LSMHPRLDLEIPGGQREQDDTDAASRNASITLMEFSIPVPSPDEFMELPRHTAVPCRQNSAGPPWELGGATRAGHFWRATPHRTYGCPQQLKVQQARPSFIKARPRGSSRGRALGSPSFPVGRARGRKGGLSHGEGAPLPVSGSSANMFGGRRVSTLPLPPDLGLADNAFHPDALMLHTTPARAAEKLNHASDHAPKKGGVIDRP